MAFQSDNPDLTFETILVNDGTPPEKLAAGLQELQMLPHFHLVTLEENHGKGFAVRKGVSHTSGEFVIYTDIDFPYSSESLYRIITALQSGADVAAGERNSAYYTNTMPVGRKILSRFTRLVFVTMLGLPVSDTQCGLKGFGTQGKSVFMKTAINRFLFDMEFLVLCRKTAGIRVVAVPVALNPGVVFFKVSTKVLLSELVNFLRILFLSVFKGRS